MLKAVLFSLFTLILSWSGFALYVAYTQPKENWLTFDDLTRLLRGEKIGPLDNLTLQEYVALTMQTAPGDPLGYKCDGSFCVPIDGQVTLATLLSGTWMITANQIAEQGIAVMPGSRSALNMYSDKPTIKMDGSTRKSLMDPEKRPMGMNSVE